MKIGYIERRVIKEKEGRETKKKGLFFFPLYPLILNKKETEVKWIVKREKGREMKMKTRIKIKVKVKVKVKIKIKMKIKIRAAFELFIFGSYFLLLSIISSR